MSLTSGYLVLETQAGNELICPQMLETWTDIPLLQDLLPAQMELLESYFELFRCPAGTILFEQGEAPNYLYILLKGTIVITYKPYDGPPINVTRLKKGDVFGWSAVIGSKYYTSGTASLSRVEAIRIRGSDLRRLVKENPETGKVFLDRLASVVSSRWKNAKAQVQVLLDEGIRKSVKKGVLS